MLTTFLLFLYHKLIETSYNAAIILHLLTRENGRNNQFPTIAGAKKGWSGHQVQLIDKISLPFHELTKITLSQDEEYPTEGNIYTRHEKLVQLRSITNVNVHRRETFTDDEIGITDFLQKVLGKKI